MAGKFTFMQIGRKFAIVRPNGELADVERFDTKCEAIAECNAMNRLSETEHHFGRKNIEDMKI